MKSPPQEVKFGVTTLEFLVGLVMSIGLFSRLYYLYYRFSYDLLNNYGLVGVAPSYFGFHKDVSDFQWREYSNVLPLLSLVLATIVALSAAIKRRNPADKVKRLMQLSAFSTTLLQFYFFNLGYLFWLAEVLFFYLLQKYLIRFRYFPHILWTISLAIIFLNDHYQGFQYQIFNPEWKYLDDFSNSNLLIQWNVVFTMTLIRIISFSIDRFWSLRKPKQDKPKDLSLKSRVETSLSPNEYSFLNYMGYLNYFPVFLTGPIITFNSFVSQVKIAQTTYTRKQIVMYVLRVIFCNYLVLELFLHVNFSTAISKVPENKHLYQHFTQYDYFITNFINLTFLWQLLKFMTFWRIARAWALIDGIEVVENMNRCVLNNYCFQQFWRGWHRSFNQWLIRYIFIPLGGNKNRIVSIFSVFTFVAIWHDINLNLLIWAWLICAAIIPESMLSSYFNKQTHIWDNWWWRYVCALGSILSINLLIISNCIAFGAGAYTVTESVRLLLFTKEGLLVLTEFSIILFFLLQIQFYLRDRQGKNF